MALTVGSRLGHYDVTALIGEGGMGQVYQATDTKLKRQVALKILPEAFSADPERLARFQREAEVLASLNHPSIAAIYGLEEADGVRALVLELVEGPTLADRIKQGPIPLDEALPIARQIADALEAAYEAGVIHRDLKPANVKVKDDGVVKVLDFGLAKALDPNPEGDPSQSPTLTAAATQMGVIMGTAAYMSPEQAGGQTADKRSDIWSFGVVLFEMLTGQQLFTGKTVSHVLARVLERELDFSVLPATTPAPIKRLLRRCLEREPKRRLADVSEALIHFEEATTAKAEPPLATPSAAQPAGWRQAVPWMLAALVVGSIITGIAVWSLMRPAPRPLARTLVTPPADQPLTLGTAYTDVAISPDGRHIAYWGTLENQPQLFVRHVDELEATPLTGLGSQARNPFISADGNWVGSFENNLTLQRTSILGGPPVTICEVDGFPRGASWGADDTIIYATAIRGSGLWRVSSGGGNPEEITTPNREEGEDDDLWPEILPGGTAVLFTITTAGPIENAQIAVLSLETGDYEILIPGGSNPRYVPTGHIVYGVTGTLRAVSFDLDRLEVTSNPIPVVTDVDTKSSGAANFAVAQDGSLVYVRGGGGGAGMATLVWVDREGRELPLGVEAAAFSASRVSPDETRVALRLGHEGGGADVYIYDVRRNNLTQLTFTGGNQFGPIWTPDGKRIVFSSDRNGAPNLYVKNADGTGEVERLTESDDTQVASSWGADNQTLVFQSGGDLHALSLEGDGGSTPLLHTEFRETRPSISPYGRWIAYESDQDGAGDVYVRSFPDVDGGSMWKVSTDGGGGPVWSPDGQELFYSSGSAVMAVPVTTDPSFEAGNPRIVFEGQYARAFNSPFLEFSLSPDGERFLMSKQPDTSTGNAPATDLVLVQNWFEELTRLVPVR